MEKLIHINSNDIKTFERIYRSNLINSVTGYKPTLLIGTYSEKNISNLGLFISVFHLGANPPLIGFIQRPIGEFSHTYKNIKRDKFYTINHVHENFVENAHFTSAKFAENISEFEKCNLEEEKFLDFNAPFVKESKIKIGLKFVEEIPIPINNTIMIIGEIVHLFIEKIALEEDGNLDLNSVKNVCTSGLETYHKVSKLIKFPYAKTNNIPIFNSK